MLGKREAITAIYGSELVNSACVRAGLSQGSIVDVKKEDWSTDTAALTANADAAFCTSGWGCPGTSIDVPTPDNLEKSVLAVGEAGALFFSYFFDEEAQAKQLVDGIADRFKCVADAVAESSPASKPRVLWAYEYEGTWTVGSCPNYYCELIAAAGGEMIMPSAAGTGIYGTYTLAEVAPLLASADIWLYPGDTWDSVVAPALAGSGSSDAALVAALSASPAVTRRRVFDLRKAGTNAWFETRIAQPDAVLQDMAAIVSPAVGDIGSRHSRIWFRNVFSESVGTIAPVHTCTDPTQPFVLQADICPLPSLLSSAAGAGAQGEGASSLSGGALAGTVVGSVAGAAALAAAVAALVLKAKAAAAASAAAKAAIAAKEVVANPAMVLRSVDVVTTA
jgi:hypothetical protein